MATALDVAKHVLFLSKRDSISVSTLKLIKLVYFCQAWALAYNRSLFDEEIQAWKYGPVIKSVYDSYKHHGSKTIYIGDDFKENEQLLENDKELIKSVWNVYKKFDAYTLRDMTHEDGTPWEQVYNGDFSTQIPNDSIENYYKEKYEI